MRDQQPWEGQDVIATALSRHGCSEASVRPLFPGHQGGSVISASPYSLTLNSQPSGLAASLLPCQKLHLLWVPDHFSTSLDGFSQPCAYNPC